jgi:ferredoxin
VDLPAFFKEEGIDVFSAVGTADLPEEDQVLVRDFFPGARSVIVFGKEVPVEVYRRPAKDKTGGMLMIAESLDRAARLLAERLNNEGIPAKAVPLYLPVGISHGRVHGLVRLKHVAAAGGLGTPGMNTVLMSPRFGPRLLLSGVVTGRPVTDFLGIRADTGKEPGTDIGFDRSGESGVASGGGIEGETAARAGTDAGTEGSLKCRMCGKCATICPGRAIGPEGVDAFRCRTISAVIPSLLVPAVKWMLGKRLLVSVMAPFAPWIARIATIRCSLCVTECPNFAGA